MPASRVQGTLYNRCPKVTRNYYSFSRKAGVHIGVYRQLKRKDPQRNPGQNWTSSERTRAC